ncbi:MAG: helix-turn-helix domain-containing protein [Nanoarchaeota archaeon]|nr:hypothetical protein [Nanoarchaeota archaeon]MBU4299679.1 hypothetical protein [Nanoarchaeota archaeon]MBU4451516.1 hypothetical protein [Nanoarchaeota archaeon]MCG2723966.1 hypothetical protein [archaeon]
MNKALFFLITVFLLFPAVASASYIDLQKTTIDLKDTSEAHIVSSITYNELTSIEFPYTVFGKITGFSARDSEGLINCSFVSQPYGGTYSCKPNSKRTANYTVVFEFDATNLVVTTADAYTFSYVGGVSEPMKRFEMILTLPEGTGLVQDPVFKPYPEATVGSTGRRMTLFWVLNSPELGKTYTFTATFEQIGQVVNYYGSYSKYLAIFFAIAFAVVLWRYWVYRKTNLGAVISVLKDDEKKVFDIILQSKGKCKQNTIVQETNFSKAKVSRILMDLEARGLVEKVRVGRTNRITISSKKRPELEAEGVSVSDTSGASSVPK